MKFILRGKGYLLLIFLLLSCFSQGQPESGTLNRPEFSHRDRHRKKIDITLRPVIKGLNLPTDIRFFSIGSNDALLTEKTGKVKWCLIAQGSCHTIGEIAVNAGPSEMGLLSLAIDPKFNTTAKIFLHYNPAKGEKRTRISEFTLSHQSMRPTSAKLEKERILLEFPQPYSNHNGGSIAFAADGYLYVGLGDGGSAGDPQGNGQKLDTLLGKILRLDVKEKQTGREYGIPKDNPFVNTAGARPEIYAYGLRNPWRLSFTPTGKVIAADVGQDRQEEINLIDKGKNYGWNVMEGNLCFNPPRRCQKNKYVAPIYVYDHQEGQSLTGGYVYGGSKIPKLYNLYVFGDFASGRLWAIDLPLGPNETTAKEVFALGKWPISPSTFSRDWNGELYVADYEQGIIYRLE